MCGISTVYFRKLFTEIAGDSPIHYAEALRIKKAKELLRSDYDSITGVAIALGYRGIYEFSRSFRRMTGISPSEYAKALEPPKN